MIYLPFKVKDDTMCSIKRLDKQRNEQLVTVQRLFHCVDVLT